MFEVSVRGDFTARHQLRLPDGSWEPLHQHDWHVDVTFVGARLNAWGVLVDFVDVERRLAEALALLQGQNLNELEVFGDRNPSAENVAVYIANEVTKAATAGAQLLCAAVEEAPGCVARYFPDR